MQVGDILLKVNEPVFAEIISKLSVMVTESSGVMQVGDILLKVNNEPVYHKSEAEIIDMVVGPPNSHVSLTVATV